MRADHSGRKWYDVLAWIGLALLAAAVIVLTAGVAGFVIGGTLGCVVYGAAFGTILVGAVGAALGAVGGIIYDAVVGNDFGTSIWTGVKIGFGIGAIVGAIAGGAVGYGAAASVTGLSNTSVFTGLGTNGAQVAATEAAKHGVITIGQTFGGKFLTAMTKVFGHALTKAAWASLSQVMASTLTMTSINLFAGIISATSIYFMYELPILVERGIEIIKHFINGG